MLSSGLIAAVLFFALAFLAVWHYWPCIAEIRRGIAKEGPLYGDYTPAARVILCLRGTDPFLDRCLRGLASQDYPNYKVLIVVDSAQDEVVPQVERLLQEHGPERIEMHVRDRLWPRCSRKISSMLCGFSRVPEEVEVLAICDADTIPHATWLRELVAPLQDKLTVAASGNRWYAPAGLSWGSLCRYYWNALAFRAMYRYRIPWGGCLALRGDLFRNPEFLDCLQHAFGEDNVIANFLANKPQKVAPIVSLVMLNEETCSIKNLWGFLVRQMLSTRLHHPQFPTIVVEAMGIFLVLWVLLPLSLIEGWHSFGWWLAGGLTYDLAVLSVVGYFESLVRKLLWKQRQQRVAPYGWMRILLALPSLALTGFIYPLAVLRTLFAKHHEWRGVVYRIEARGVSTVQERDGFTDTSAGKFDSV